MGYTKKTLEELDVIDDFLMNAITADEEVGEDFCRCVLSVLLKRKIGKIRIVSQRTIPAPIPDFRGIRMDVEIEESTETQIANVYDLEPHLHAKTNLAKRNRFYQAKIDGRYMKSGDDDFAKLPHLYVITISNFDPFGYDYMMYTVQNGCVEIPELKYEDGLQFIYFYTGGTKGGSKEIKAMLQYLQDSTADNVTDAATQEVHNYVSKVKVMPEVRRGYMKFDEIIYYEKRDTMLEDVFALLEEYGEVPEELREKLDWVMDLKLLKKYLKLAAKVDSIDDFVKEMETVK